MKKLIKDSLRTGIEFAAAKRKHYFDRFNNKTPKIKLVAIAKNEAAYLPEWIAHHLYFGFDHIEININRTSDNSLPILSKFSELPQVTIRDADAFFNSYKGNPQVGLYREAIVKARKEGFSHICFLDIDEFWVSKDLNSTIHDCLNSISRCDVISFEWANKYEPENQFGPAISQQVQVQRRPQVKSIIDTRSPYYRLNPHNIVNPFLEYRNASGEVFKHINDAFSCAPDIELKQPFKPYFIIHRYYRSEVEYIATLGRGRPKFPDEGNIKIKGNRKGYSDKDDAITINFDADNFYKYQQHMQNVLKELLEETEVRKAQNFVRETYEKVLIIVENSDKKDEALLTRSFKNIKDDKAVASLKKFQARHR